MSKWRQKANAMAEVAEEEEEIQKRVWATFRGRALQTNHHHYPIMKLMTTFHHHHKYLMMVMMICHHHQYLMMVLPSRRGRNRRCLNSDSINPVIWELLKVSLPNTITTSVTE